MTASRSRWVPLVLHCVTERAPTEEERRIIVRQTKPDFASLGCLTVTFGIFPGWLLGIVGHWLGSFTSPEAARYAQYGGWGIGAILLCYGFVWYWPHERRRRSEASADAEELQVQEISVDDATVIELGLISDNEPILVFDIGDGKLLYLQGQWLRHESTYGAPEIVDDGNDEILNLLDAPYSFPSDSFTVTRLPHSGTVLGIHVTGQYLRPPEPIEALTPEYQFNDSELLEGELTDIANVLKAEHATRRGT